MTIPKFRVWDKISKTMFPVMMIDFGQSYVMIEEINGLWCERDFDEIELMQYTGLHDVHGKEVFEGDIIQTERYFDGFTDVKLYKGVVKQLEGLWMIETGNDAVPVFSEIEENIVIGNIYENPELLEEE